MPLTPIETKLEKIFHLTPTVRTFRLRFPEGKWIPFKAGQFCMVQVPKEGFFLHCPNNWNRTFFWFWILSLATLFNLTHLTHLTRAHSIRVFRGQIDVF